MPNSLSELHTLHAWEDNQITERCTQGEYAGKVLQFKLVDKDGAIDLTNCIVQYAVTRPDKTEDLLDCTVDNGVVKCNLTYSATSISGLVHGEVRVVGSNDSGIIKFYGVNLRVYKGVSDEAAEQSDEFTALVAALQKVVSITPDPDSENTYVVRLDDSIVQNGLNPVASGVIYNYLQGNYRQISFAHENNESSYDDGGVYIDDATDIKKMYYVKNSNGARVGILFCVQTLGYNYASQVKIDAYGNIRTRVKTQESGEADYTWKSWTPVGTTRNIQDYAVTTPKLADGAVTSDKIDASVVTRGIIYDFVTALTALDSTITDNGTKPVASGTLKNYLEGSFQDYLVERFTKRIYAHETHSSGYDADTNPVDTYSDGGVYIDEALDPSTIYIIKNSNGAHIGTLLCAHANGYNRTTQIALYSDGRFQYRYRHNTSGVWDEWENIARDSTVFDAVVRNYQDVAADITFNIHNTKVDEFLQTAAYDSSDYSYSNLPTADSTNWDRPNTMTIDIPSGSSKFILYDTITKTERIEPTSGTTHTIDNLIPNRNYAYTVRKSDGSLLSHGIIKAIGQVRMINAGGDDAETDRTFNIRDLGGWSADGGKLKYGLIYRGGELNGSISINTTQQQFFKNVLGIRNEIDLRDSGGSGVGATALGVGVNYYNFATGYSPSILIENDKYAKKRADVIKQLAKNIKNNEPTYIHCQAGADRTSVICTFIKAICGVSQSDIDRDHELSYYSYQADSSRVRKRNNMWANGHRVMINGDGTESYSQPYINNMEGTSFQDKIVRLLLRSGVTIDEINDIRFGLIDGSPSKLTNPYGNATVTKSLTGVAIDNTTLSTALYQPYEATLTVNNLYKLESVALTMGGNNAISYYSNGKIYIPVVTGNIVIGASATQSEIITENMIDDGVVTTNKIFDGAVTDIKLANKKWNFVDLGQVNSTSVFDDYVNTETIYVVKVAAIDCLFFITGNTQVRYIHTVGWEKRRKVNDTWEEWQGAIFAQSIQNNAITTDKIANLNVTEGKLSSELQAKINKKTGVYSYTIPASNWSNNAQSLNLSSVYTVTSNTKVDIEADDTALEQLSIDDCEGIYVENNNGTLTIKAITNSPTENITVQLVVYEVETLS